MEKLLSYLRGIQRRVFEKLSRKTKAQPIHVSTPNYYSARLDEHIRLLQDGKHRAIPWIFCIFTGNDDTAKLKASKTLYAALVDFSFDDIVKIDRQMRDTTSMEWSINWRLYDIDSFFTPDMDEEERKAVVVFSSFNPNGYIREKAIRMLAELDCTLPFILLRKNDWVEQVRNAASEASQLRLQRLSSGELVMALPFAERLARDKESPYWKDVKPILDLLGSEAHFSDMIDGLRNPSIRTRRFCIHALFDSATPNLSFALDYLSKEPEPSLRAMLFRSLIECGAQAEKAAMSLLRDKFPQNRIMAFQYLCERDNKQIQAIAIGCLLDKNAAMREKARRVIHDRNPEFDFVAFYRSNLSDGYPPAILGLGETGAMDDISWIQTYFADPRVNTVNAVMTAMMRLNAAECAPLITAMLEDSRVGVVKQASLLIVKYQMIDKHTVRDIFERSSWESTKLMCVSILVIASNKWERIVFLLEVLSSNAELDDLRADAQSRIEQWIKQFNRSQIQPSDQQRRHMAALIKVNEEILPHNVVRFLQFLL
ncbi:hypothetical protein LJC74_06100 [Eubacteriales bacterium OttesenSCG-928-A19]|nr:hypothetical protein [Eubacteriales bacterium OttesenSCG-928-A19]